jgi:Xaa-Pro aminopeptidase
MLFRGDLNTMAKKIRDKVFAACDRDLHAIVSTDPAHVGYLCGYRSIILDAMREYRCAVIATPEKAVLITGASDAAPALEVIRDPACIYRYGVFYVEASGGDVDYTALPKQESTFIDALRRCIAAFVRPGHLVGFDGENPWEVEQLKNLIGSSCFDARPAIVKARHTKLPEEIERLGRAAAITEAGMEEAFRHAALGVSEIELSTLIASKIRGGGGIPRLLSVSSGQRSALADTYATATKLTKGDLLRLDIACTVDGYWADTARTAVIEQANSVQQERYDALMQGELEQLRLAKVGVTAADLFNIAIKRVREGALPNYRRNHCGHGIGISVHEFPQLNGANDKVPIEDGMVLCVETPYYEVGWGGMMVEDMIVIRNGGNERLTHMPRELRVL